MLPNFFSSLGLLDLPPEIIEKIIDYVPGASIPLLAKTNEFLCNVIIEKFKKIWNTKFSEKYAEIETFISDYLRTKFKNFLLDYLHFNKETVHVFEFLRGIKFIENKPWVEYNHADLSFIFSQPNFCTVNDLIQDYLNADYAGDLKYFLLDPYFDRWVVSKNMQHGSDIKISWEEFIENMYLTD